MGQMYSGDVPEIVRPWKDRCKTLEAENAKLREELVRMTARYIAENDELRLALVMSRADGLVALEQRGKALLENAELRSKYERLRGAIA